MNVANPFMDHGARIADKGVRRIGVNVHGHGVPFVGSLVLPEGNFLKDVAIKKIRIPAIELTRAKVVFVKFNQVVQIIRLYGGQRLLRQLLFSDPLQRSHSVCKPAEEGLLTCFDGREIVPAEERIRRIPSRQSNPAANRQPRECVSGKTGQSSHSPPKLWKRLDEAGRIGTEEYAAIGLLRVENSVVTQFRPGSKLCVERFH